MRFPWGRYRGEAVRAVPSSYLVWAFENATLSPDLCRAIQAELACRYPPPPPRDRNGQDGPLRATLHPMAARLLRAGLRALAQVHHPDHGGDDATMRAVLETYRGLRTLLQDAPGMRRARAPPIPMRDWTCHAAPQHRKGIVMINPEKYRKAAYLKASDLLATQTRARIHTVIEEEVGTPAELKVVLSFTSDKLKPFIVNYTNCVTLVEGFGADEHQWVGKVIILVKTKTLFQGKSVDAIRIQCPPQAAPAIASPPPPALSSTDTDAPVCQDEADLA